MGIINKNTYLISEKLDLLVASLSGNMLSVLLNSSILTIVFWNKASNKSLIYWYIANVLFIGVRAIMVLIYKKGYKKDDFLLWEKILIVSAVTTAAFFSSMIIILLVYDVIFVYILFFYFVIAIMVAGNVVAAHNNLKIYFPYTITLFLIPTLAIYLIQNTITTPMVIMGLLFYGISLLSVLRLNRNLNQSLKIQYDNILLIERLNIEKKQTDDLNLELIVKNEKLKEITLVDPLTGLSNRRYLYEVLMDEIEITLHNIWLNKKGTNRRNDSENKGFGIFVIDIDFFKKVNDTYGHDSGDLVLKQFSNILTRNVRQDDVVARIGGEEFIMILKNTHESYIATHAEKIRKLVETNKFEISDDRVINLTCTIGFIFYPFFISTSGILNFEQAVSLSDRALYHGKQNGRNKSVKTISSFQLCSDENELRKIASNLNMAIENKKIEFEII
ncbi:MAG: GGDEF domain-containing protein [Desulfobacterales bacterium]|nr:GGDEF domain-containing protein [Desulfobacterales bacterium]